MAIPEDKLRALIETLVEDEVERNTIPTRFWIGLTKTICTI